MLQTVCARRSTRVHARDMRDGTDTCFEPRAISIDTPRAARSQYPDKQFSHRTGLIRRQCLQHSMSERLQRGVATTISSGAARASMEVRMLRFSRCDEWIGERSVAGSLLQISNVRTAHRQTT